VGGPRTGDWGGSDQLGFKREGGGKGGAVGRVHKGDPGTIKVPKADLKRGRAGHRRNTYGGLSTVKNQKQMARDAEGRGIEKRVGSGSKRNAGRGAWRDCSKGCHCSCADEQGTLGQNTKGECQKSKG